MANKRISSLGSLGGTPAVGDIIPITDISDTVGSAQGTTKKVTVANLVAAAPQGDLLASNNLSDVANAGTSRTNLGLGTAATTASTDYASAFYNIVTKTGNYTLTNAENGKVIFCNSSSRIDITVPSGLTSGFNCRVVQGGAGRVLFVTSGTTINGYTSGSDAPNAVIGQHGVADLVPTGTNIYSLHGDISYLSLYSNTYSISLDGTDDYINCGNDSSLELANLTYSVWFKASGSVAAINYILAKAGSRYGSVYIRYTSANKFAAFLGFASSAFIDNILSSSSYTLTDWHHVALTYDQTNVKLYVDGVEEYTASETRAVDYTQDGSSSTDFNIGRTAYGYPSPAEGLVDEVAIFNSALTAAQITNIYKGEASGGSGGTNGVPGSLSTFNPLSWWRMGDIAGGTGTTITDQGTGSNDGTLTNGPTFSTTVPS